MKRNRLKNHSYHRMKASFYRGHRRSIRTGIGHAGAGSA